MDIHILPDIYFTPEYGRLYERHENGTLEQYLYETARGTVYFQFIRRTLSGFAGFERYSDIITPYGYGGPIFLRTNEADKPTLANDFKKAFGEYCRDTKTVSAFVRFHPIIGNAVAFREAFDAVVPIRKTVAIDLSKDLLYEEFDSTVRSTCRNAEKRHLTVRYDTSLETMDKFVSLYYSLMDKKNTQDYYYFPQGYFEELKKLGASVEIASALKDGETVASTLFLKYGQFLHTHLSTSTLEGNKSRAMEFLNASRSLLAKEEGFRWNHLGGGFSNDPEDSLYLFKRKFSKGPPFDFYVGKCVYDQEAYRALCAIAAGRHKQIDENFFPQYRA